MEEGSVVSDETYVPSAETEVDTGSEEAQEETQEQPQTEEQQERQDEPQLTDKGTKLDPNPLSAAHQQLANERAKIRQYEQVLSNPDYLRAYAQQMGISLQEARAEVKEAAKFSADKLQTAEDVVEAFNSVTSEIEAIRQENQQLREQLFGVVSSGREQQIVSKLQTDISAVQSKYPELDPKSSEYDAELEKELATLYQELDFDPTRGSYRGQVSITGLADRLMGAASRARKRGSEDAQTQVKTKQAGRVVTSSKASKKETAESKDPATAIAQRIAAAMNQG